MLRRLSPGSELMRCKKETIDEKSDSIEFGYGVGFKLPMR